MCQAASGWAKLALAVLLVALIIHVVGLFTICWMNYETTNGVVQVNVGMWSMESCNSGTCTSTSVASQYETDAFNAVRAMETITFCLVVFTSILLMIYLCAILTRRSRMAFVIMCLCYLAGTCSFVGMIVFITTIPTPFEISWSLGLTVIAMTLILIAGTLLIPDAFDSDYSDDYDEDDDYFNHNRRSVVSPMSLRQDQARGITPISYRGGVEGSRWRSY